MGEELSLSKLMSAPENTNYYIPGTCNIGPKQLVGRKRTSILAAALSISLILFLLIFRVDKVWRLTLFLPAATFGVTFQQWYYKFCVAIGMKGIFNFGQKFTAEQKENFKKDRIKVLKMLAVGILFGIVITALFCLLP